jgi:exosortase
MATITTPTLASEPGKRPFALVADRPLLLACLSAATLLLAAAWPVLSWWHWEYTKPNSYYGHGFFVPVLVAVMLWHQREKLARVPKAPAPLALIVLIPALLFLVVSPKKDMQAIMSWSFLTTILASVWLVAGGKFVRAAALPLAFLWLMAPLPGPLLNDATHAMQTSSTIAAGKILQGIGFGAHQNGNLISMDNYTLNVDVPCSGFNLLLRLLTFSAAFAYLTDTSRGRKLLLFALSLPLSLLINSLRIASIGIVGECLGMSAATTFHDWGGLLSLVLCMAILFGIAKVLGCRTFAGQPIF